MWLKRDRFPITAKKIGKSLKKKKKSIVLNILYVLHNTEETRHGYKSKYDEKCENKVILLTINDGKNGIILLWKVCLHHLEE